MKAAMLNRKSIQGQKCESRRSSWWSGFFKSILRVYLKDCLSSPLYSNNLLSLLSVSSCVIFSDNQTHLCFLDHIQNQPQALGLHIHWFQSPICLMASFLQIQVPKFQLLGVDAGLDPFCCSVHLVLYCNLCPFFFFHLSFFSPLARFLSITPPICWDPSASGYVRQSSCYVPSWRSPALGGISPACSCVSSSACRCTTFSRSTPPHAAGLTAQSAAWYPWTMYAIGRFGLTSRPCCKSYKASRPWSLLWTGLWTSQRGRRCHVPWARPQSPPGGLRGWGGPGSVWSRALGSGRCTRLHLDGRDGETGGPAP